MNLFIIFLSGFLMGLVSHSIYTHNLQDEKSDSYVFFTDTVPEVRVYIEDEHWKAEYLNKH